MSHDTDKLIRQLVKHKQKLTDHHRGGASMGSLGAVPPGSAAESAPSGGATSGGAEESYEDVVKRMGEE